MKTIRVSQIAVAALLVAAALAVGGAFVWNITTTGYFGPPGHFTRSVQQQVYPHRAEALWVAAAVFAALGGLAAIAARRGTIDAPQAP